MVSQTNLPMNQSTRVPYRMMKCTRIVSVPPRSFIDVLLFFANQIGCKARNPRSGVQLTACVALPVLRPQPLSEDGQFDGRQQCCDDHPSMPGAGR
jgi:hypothetical protein